MYTLLSPIQFAIVSFPIGSFFSSANIMCSCAAVSVCCPSTPKYRFEPRRTTSDADKPHSPSSASRLRRQWLPRALGEYLGALRIVSVLEATKTARPSRCFAACPGLLPSGRQTTDGSHLKRTPQELAMPLVWPSHPQAPSPHLMASEQLRSWLPRNQSNENSPSARRARGSVPRPLGALLLAFSCCLARRTSAP